MADFGADVIKIEPPGGDTYRTRGAGYPPCDVNFPWIVDNRSKRGVAIDLRVPDGQRLLHHLVRGADVFVTNTPLDARERLAIRHEDLAPLNARLIYASVTAYGESGEEAASPASTARRCGRARASWISSGRRPRRRPRGRCGDGRPSHRDVALRRHHGRAVPAGADRPRHDGRDVAHGERALVERHPGAGDPERSAHGDPTARARRPPTRCPITTAVATAAGS
jgi:hypothetical protein